MSERTKEGLQCLILYAVLWLLQIFLPALFGARTAPDLVLTVTAGLMFLTEDRQKWMVCGLIAAFLWDLVFGFYVGIGLASMLVICLLILAVQHVMELEGLVMYLIYLAAAVFLYTTVSWVFSLAGGAPYGYLYALRALPVCLIMDLITGLILYWIILRADFRLRRKNWYR